jgi:hypothetical protein
MNIHYSKAIGKYWRNIPFYFLTSISSEETQSYEDVFGSGAKWKLRDFSYLFHNMMLDGRRMERKSLSVSHKQTV